MSYETSTEQNIIRGILFRRFSSDQEAPNSQQLRILEETIQMVPMQHTRSIVAVEARRPARGDRKAQPPRKGGGNSNGVIRLSAVSFSNDYNQEMNITFLHELGHVIDSTYNCTSEIQRFARDRNHILRNDARDLLDTPIDPERATHGAGERVADCYQILLKWLKTGQGTNSRILGGRYIGSEAQKRFRVLLATSAFSQFSLEMLTRSIRNPTEYLMNPSDDLTDESFNQLIRSLLR